MVAPVVAAQAAGTAARFAWDALGGPVTKHLQGLARGSWKEYTGSEALLGQATTPEYLPYRFGSPGPGAGVNAQWQPGRGFQRPQPTGGDRTAAGVPAARPGPQPLTMQAGAAVVPGAQSLVTNAVSNRYLRAPGMDRMPRTPAEVGSFSPSYRSGSQATRASAARSAGAARGASRFAAKGEVAVLSSKKAGLAKAAMKLL
jgi:hypothetical protein